MLLLYAEQNATYIPLLQNAQHEALSYRLRLYERVNRRTLLPSRGLHPLLSFQRRIYVD